MESCKILRHSNSKAWKAAQQANAQAIYSVPQEGLTVCWVMSGRRWSKVQNRAALHMCLYQSMHERSSKYISMCSFLNATSFIYGYGHMAQKNGYRSFRGDPGAWNEWVTYSRTCWEGILSWPGISTTCHSWIWIKGMNHILGDVWIMGMHRGYGSHVGPGYGSEPYILSHGQYQSYHSQRLSPRRDAPSGSKIHQSPLKHWGTLPTWAVCYSLGLGFSPRCSIHWKENGETSNSTWCYKWKTLPH